MKAPTLRKPEVDEYLNLKDCSMLSSKSLCSLLCLLLLSVFVNMSVMADLKLTNAIAFQENTYLVESQTSFWGGIGWLVCTNLVFALVPPFIIGLCVRHSLRHSNKKPGYDKFSFFVMIPILSIVIVSPLSLLFYHVSYGKFPYLSQLIFFGCGAAWIPLGIIDFLIGRGGGVVDHNWEWRVRGRQFDSHSRHATRREVYDHLHGEGAWHKSVGMIFIGLLIVSLIITIRAIVVTGFSISIVIASLVGWVYFIFISVWVPANLNKLSSFLMSGVSLLGAYIAGHILYYPDASIWFHRILYVVDASVILLVVLIPVGIALYMARDEIKSVIESEIESQTGQVRRKDDPDIIWKSIKVAESHPTLKRLGAKSIIVGAAAIAIFAVYRTLPELNFQSRFLDGCLVGILFVGIAITFIGIVIFLYGFIAQEGAISEIAGKLYTRWSHSKFVP